MSQAVIESAFSQFIQEYKKIAESMIKKGLLFTLFKLQTDYIRKQSTGSDEDFVQDKIVELMELLKQVADQHLTCLQCHTAYKFRICSGLSREHDNAIELTCEVCGDCYSQSEKGEYVSYFNFHAWRQVDELRRRSRGFTVNYTLGSLPEKAVLIIYDDKLKRPELRINGRRVFDPEEVKCYWEYAKRIVRLRKNGDRVDKANYQIREGFCYHLDEDIA